MGINEVRNKYLKFFESRGHKIIPSAPLVISEDPTTLFTSSGMQPLVPYLLGKPHPEGNRLVNSQKAIRTIDIDEVGDNRHLTFFEMLGNWSLGDYFKKEQLNCFFQFLTEELKFEPQKLYITVFEGNQFVEKDSQSIAIWQEIFKNVGINAKEGERIFAYPAEKNWWSRSGEPEKMPNGEPGGPDSEVFYDFGLPHKKEFGQKCHPNCDCGRFMEIGNNVFMQYQKQVDGSLKELSQKNVDFGGGLERLVAATINQPDIFLTDAFLPIIAIVEKQSGKKYGQTKEISRLMRIVSDHLRASVFIGAEGITASNIEQGYVLRRLLRRAMRAGRLLGLEKGFFAALIEETIKNCREIFPELGQNQNQIKETILGEEEKFGRTLDNGIRQLEKVIVSGVVSTAQAFNLYETYGFPIELTLEMLKEKKVSLDNISEEKFKEEFKKHQELSRAGAAKKFGGVGENAGIEVAKLHTASHLLHQALRQILGSHIRQMGSDVTAERLRFDFSHPQKMAVEEIKAVEDLVNLKIKEDLPVIKEEMSYNQAIRSGALAFFKGKYPEKVTVYSIDGFSKEICAGPHANRTSDLGIFKITKEDSSSAGVRRIKAALGLLFDKKP